MIDVKGNVLEARPEQARIKVLYIGGYLRVGSTLLDRMLGQCEGFVSVGELRRIWEENFAEDQPCGCGAPFSGCDFWQRVIERAYGGFDRIDVDKIVRLKRRVDRMRHIPRLMSPWKRSGYREALTEYAEILASLYAAIQEVSNGRVIVDSSKDPSYAYVLANLPNVDLHVVHLVRDSRAVAYSWLRKKVKHEAEKGKKVYMPQRSPIGSSVGWMRANLLVEPLKVCGIKHLAIRYEDFLAAPRSSLDQIVALLQEPEQSLPFLDGHTVRLDAAHTVAGNPMRFQSGTIELRPDQEWKGKMEQHDRRVVTMMTWPLLLRYGYLGKVNA